MRKKINVLIKSDLLIITNPIYICEKKNIVDKPIKSLPPEKPIKPILPIKKEPLLPGHKPKKDILSE